MYALTQPNKSEWTFEFQLRFNKAVKARSFIEGVIGYALEASAVTATNTSRNYRWNTDMTLLVVTTTPRDGTAAERFNEFWRLVDQYMSEGTPMRVSNGNTRMISLPANQRDRVEVVRHDDVNPVALAEQDLSRALARFDTLALKVRNGTATQGDRINLIAASAVVANKHQVLCTAQGRGE